MQQVKIFKSVDTEIPEMERQINRWMRKSGARVLSITGNLSASPHAGSGAMNSFAASDILVIVLYEIDLPPS
jgi:hypothetical protein